jgi:hypothetical protein
MLIISHAVGTVPRMSLRRFFAMLIAVAMIFAPLAMQEGAAMAAPGPSHHGAMSAEADHCGANASHRQDRDKSADKSCCAAMCIGIAIAPVSAGRALAHSRMILRPSAEPFRRGYLGEIATPPPRFA